MTPPPTPDPTATVRDGLRDAIQVYRSRLKALARVKGARQRQIFTAEELDPARASLCAWIFRAANAYAKHLAVVASAAKKVAQNWAPTSDVRTAGMLVARLDGILEREDELLAIAGEAAFTA
ncbi:MAG: hypothetical protein WCO97_10715 [bacterium]